jgi:hypothetical protein
MSSNREVKALVDRGVALVGLLQKLGEELEQIEERLSAIGLISEQEELKDAEREGRRWLAEGSKFTVPVIFTADKIAGEFNDKSTRHTELERLAGRLLKEFYKPVTKWVNLYSNGKQFRAYAAEILDDRAPAFISAALARDKYGVPKSDVRVQWADAEEVK